MTIITILSSQGISGEISGRKPWGILNGPSSNLLPSISATTPFVSASKFGLHAKNEPNFFLPWKARPNLSGACCHQQEFPKQLRREELVLSESLI